jgi:lysozyme family protein
MDEVTILKIQDDLIRREGGRSDRAEDHGGPTNWGITMPTLAEDLHVPVTAAGLKDRLWNMSEHEARDLYLRRYIVGPGFADLFDGLLLEEVVDAAVNNGRGRCIQWLQHLVEVTEDGVIGPQTRVALLQQVADDRGWLYDNHLGRRLEAYADLLRVHHEQVVFVHGWLDRVAEFIRRRSELRCR